MAEGRPWYEEAFGADYLRVYPHRDLAAARAEAASLIEHGLRGRLLDLCCGFGRHVQAFLGLGLDAWGVDLSAELLHGAASGPGAPALAGRLLRADARRLPFRPRSFESVSVLFSSFGYFGEKGDRTVAAEVARVLRPDGIAVIDLMNPPRARASLVPASSSERDGWRLEERRSLEDGGRRVVKHVLLRAPGGTTRDWREDVRLYERDEITELLRGQALEPYRVDGGLSGGAHEAHSDRMVVWARRAAR